MSAGVAASGSDASAAVPRDPDRGLRRGYPGLDAANPRCPSLA